MRSARGCGLGSHWRSAWTWERRNRAELQGQAEIVSNVPNLGELAVGDPPKSNCLVLNLPPCGRHAEDRPLLSSARRQTRPDLVSFGNHVFNRYLEIGEAGIVERVAL